MSNLHQNKTILKNENEIEHDIKVMIILPRRQCVKSGGNAWMLICFNPSWNAQAISVKYIQMLQYYCTVV